MDPVIEQYRSNSAFSDFRVNITRAVPGEAYEEVISSYRVKTIDVRSIEGDIILTADGCQPYEGLSPEQQQWIADREAHRKYYRSLRRWNKKAIRMQLIWWRYCLSRKLQRLVPHG